MLFTGLPISAKEAYDAGLVSKVVPKDKFGKIQESKHFNYSILIH